MQKKEKTKSFFKKVLGRVFNTTWSDATLKQVLMDYDEKLLIQGLEEAKFSPNRLFLNKTPLLIEAVKRDLYDFALKLVEKGADVNQPDVEGNAPVHQLANTWYNAQNRKFWPLLKKAGANFNQLNKKGQTPLVALIEEQNETAPFFSLYTDRFELDEDKAAYLIKFGADVNFKDQNGQTPLHKAILNESLASVLFLVKKGADLNSQNQRGQTPLILAISGKRLLQIAKRLITPQTDLLLQNQEGIDAYNLAMKMGDREIASLIKQELLRRRREGKKKAKVEGLVQQIAFQHTCLNKRALIEMMTANIKD